MPLLGGLCPVNRFFNGVRRFRAEVLEVRRVCHCVPANGVPCIPRGKRPRERDRWASDQLFHRLAQRGLAVVRAGRHGVLVSAMFRAA